MGSLWGHFGDILRSHWGHFEITWGQSGIILASFWRLSGPRVCPQRDIGNSRISSATAGMGPNPDSRLEIQPFYRIWLAGLEPDYLRLRSMELHGLIKLLGHRTRLALASGGCGEKRGPAWHWLVGSQEIFLRKPADRQMPNMGPSRLYVDSAGFGLNPRENNGKIRRKS